MHFIKDDRDLEYYLLETIVYTSKRYACTVTVRQGRKSDGASGAVDIQGSVKCLRRNEMYHASASWWVHDELCFTGTWDDGTEVTNWQASMVLRDILKQEGHSFRARTWTWATFLFGGDKLRKV